MLQNFYASISKRFYFFEIVILFYFSFLQFAYADPVQERPIENRNLYIPNIFFFEPYPTTPKAIGEKKVSYLTGFSAANMIDNNNALGDRSDISKIKPIYWSALANEFYDGKLNFQSYSNADFYLYGKLEQQRNVFVDVEVYRANHRVSYGLSKKIEVSAEVTILSYNKGFLDSVITGYHRAINTAYPLRDIYPDDKFHYSISDSSRILINAKPRTSLGDSVFDIKWQFLDGSKYYPMMALIVGTKIPTGHVAYSMGTGFFDFAGGLSMKYNFYDFFLFSNSFVKTNHKFFKSDEIQIIPTFQTAFTIGYHITERWAPIIQIEYKSSPYKTEIFPLFQPSIILSFGFNYKYSESCSSRFHIAEDPAFESRTVPDVGGQISVFCIP